MDGLAPLLGFAIVASVTPGPNVLMVAAAAARHGIGPVWPHMLGITAGFALMLLVVGAGLAAPLTAAPGLHKAMKWVGFAWLLWLAWQIARAGSPTDAPARPPLGFLGAAAFQWINPKAWLIAVAAIAAFADPGASLLEAAARIALVFAAVSIPCLLVWAGLGAALRGWLAVGRRARAFNLAMALLLVASLIPAL
jgi:threonine/homoserine/homoserine lactone efflux protein